jgi:tRNA U34 5-methylaminomethyl-2-thiouridine-forming methyltransferase MnmC
MYPANAAAVTAEIAYRHAASKADFRTDRGAGRGQRRRMPFRRQP